MRSIFAVLAFGAAILCTASAQAERRMFIISNNANGYGVDARCLASGASCGTAVANTYCRSREFNSAVSYRKVDREEITGAVPTGASGGCRGAACDEFVAIECVR